MTTLNMNNTNAMTGMGYVFGIDYDRGFYSHEVVGHLDAPNYTLVGSTIKNKFDGEDYAIANITWRAA